MLELLAVMVFLWLAVKCFGLLLKLTWGMAKIIASVLMVLALPLLIVCLVFASGLALLLPIGMIALAAGIVKTTV